MNGQLDGGNVWQEKGEGKKKDKLLSLKLYQIRMFPKEKKA